MKRNNRGYQQWGHGVKYVLILGMTSLASADVTEIRQNLDKYWNYRAMQRTNFLRVGTGQGCSEPARWRCVPEAQMSWGDTTIDTGWYVGALTTEHYMLSHPELFPGYAYGGGDLNTCRNELQYALLALDRLDATAEACWLPSFSDQPGFFIRDDVPASFYQYFPSMNHVISDYTNPETTAKEMSQDQCVHVLLGLALVKKLIPADLVVNGMNLRQHAVQRGGDIVDWVHQHGWTIYNPVTDMHVNRGEDARAFGKGFNKSCVYLTDGARNFDSSVSGFYSWMWGTLSDPGNPAYSNDSNRHMAMCLAATGNGWDNSTLNALMSLADPYDWYAYPLLYAVVQEPIPQQQGTWAGHQATINSVVQTQLNLAPANGPHEPITPEEENTGWCADQKFIRNLNSQNHGGATDGYEYCGMDYLLLHNIFYIVTPSLWQDPTPPGPGPVTSFAAAASDQQITLSWTNPSAPSFARTMIRYSTAAYPAGPTSGTLVADKANTPGSGDNYVHTGLVNGAMHYYAAFAHDGQGHYASGVYANATPVDNVPPGPATNFTATAGDQQVSLSWTKPAAPDFAGIVIRYKTTGYPTSPTDGAEVYRGTGTSLTHSGLTNHIPCYYSAFAYDEVPNYSTKADAMATPVPSGSVCFLDEFAYPNGNLNGNPGWSGSATSQVAIVNQAVKILGGGGSYDAGRSMTCSDPGTGSIRVAVKVQKGSGSSIMWSLWCDDPAGNNLARWYGTGTTARGRIGSSSSLVTSEQTLTGGWDTLVVRIDPLANTSTFIFNSETIGTLDHSSTGAGNTLGRLRFERMDNAGAAGQYLYFDNLLVGESQTRGDFDGDEDVDQEDFGHLQACSSGEGVTYQSGCQGADLNGDGDVDGGDIDEFRNCMNGPDRPPGC